MFVDSLLGDVPSRSLTVRALHAITEIDLLHIPGRQAIPQGPGVYVWAPGYDCGVWYIGSGSGWNGLWSRLGTWFSALEAMREQNIGPDPLVEDGAAWWAPAVRAAYLHQLKCYGNSVPEDSSASAKEWEARMQQANRIAAGNVSVLGGGAWENKEGSLAFEADLWAWDRLRAMQREAEGLRPSPGWAGEVLPAPASAARSQSGCRKS